MLLTNLMGALAPIRIHLEDSKMKFIAINGSPRKKWNTATILEKYLEGARSVDPAVETELVNLYDLKYKGCISCFQCKLLGGPSYGKCAVKDDLAPVLEKSLYADALIIGSPIYFSDFTGMTRCYLERLYFPNFVYDKDYSTIAPKKFRSTFVFTMNVPENVMEEYRYPEKLGMMLNFAARLFGYAPITQYVNNTYQFRDYSKYASSLFNPVEKAEYREKHFPLDCEKAFENGANLAKAIKG